jgi:hypothetical protein
VAATFVIARLSMPPAMQVPALTRRVALHRHDAPRNADIFRKVDGRYSMHAVLHVRVPMMSGPIDPGAAA